MADFYQDLLGSIDKSPLDKLAERDTAASKKGQLEVADAALKPKTSVPATFLDANQSGPELRNRQVASSKKLLAERPVLVDTPVVRSVLVAPVLRGALPKLAPTEEATIPLKQTDRALKSDVATQTADEQRSSPVCTEALAVARPESVPVISTRKGLDSQVAPITPQLDAVSESDSMVVSPKKTEWLENGRPSWAQDRFECLLFVVAGLTLAVPLVSLGAVYRLDDELISLVGRASWFMGLYRQSERSVQVVDTAQWVMPDRWTPEVRNGYRFIIRLGSDSWGLATDSVQQSINLAPEQVKWRTERSKRSWLAGTVIDHMCALLDADKLAEMLSEEALKNRR